MQESNALLIVMVQIFTVSLVKLKETEDEITDKFGDI